MYRDQKKYYVGGHNVSESHISEEYSMKFDQDKEESKQNYHASMSQKHPQGINPQQLQQQSSYKSPKLLPQSVFKCIKERYCQLKRLNTDDPNILFQFYMFYRKADSGNRQKTIEDLEKKIRELRKLSLKAESEAKIEKIQKKLQFERILIYDLNDVYYTLVHEKKKIDLDRQVTQKMRLKQEEFAKKSKPNRRVSEEVMNRLYKQQTKQLTPEQQQQVSRIKLGKKLLQMFRERQEYEQVELSVDNVYDMWLKNPNKMKYGLEADSKKVQEIIRHWMYLNISNLIEAYQHKKGVKTRDPQVLYKFLYQMNSQSINYFQVFIPPKGFSVFFQQYSKKQKDIDKARIIEQERIQNRKLKLEKQIKQKALRRPISSTPISVLAQPKKNTEEILELIRRYPKDKNLKRILAQNAIPIIRRPEEYGVHSLQEEIKIKNRVKLQTHKNVDKTIQNIILLKTFNMETQQFGSPLFRMLNDQSLHKRDEWEKKKQIFKQALKAEVHSAYCLSRALHQFAQKYVDEVENPASYDNNKLIDKIVSKLGEQDNYREKRLIHLKNMLNTIRLEEQEKQTEQQKKKKIGEKEQKRKFYRFLTQWAKMYIQNFIQAKSQNQLRSDFMKQFYKKAVQFHRSYVNKHFPVVEHQQEKNNIYSKLLKYQFFKMVKDINPQTLEKDELKKNAAWIPAGKSDGFHTFNWLSTSYNPSTSVTKRKKDEKKNTIWGSDKGDQRIKFLMKMQDADECTFKPSINKMVL